MANKVRDFVVNSLKQFNEYLQENILPLYSNKQSDWNTSNTNDDSYIKNKPTIPPEVTESTVASWGFTKNTGSLTIETDPVFSASAAHSISANNITNWNNKVSNVQGDWNTTNPSDESYIKNKPAIPSIEGLATETYVIDKISSQSYVTSSQLSSQGYLTSFTESDPVFRNSAASVITAQNILDWNAKVSNVQADWNEDDNTEESYINNKPYIENTYFVAATSSQAGNGSSTTTYLSTKWEANISSITDIYDGLVLILRMPSNLGVARAGAVLSINNGNYHPITYNVTTPIGTRFNTSYMLMLTYNANASAVTYLTAGTKTTTTGVWQMLADYDTNTNTDTKVRQWKDGSVMSVTTANNTDEHPILATYTLANNSNYKDQTAIYNPSYTLNTVTGEMIVGKISLLDGILSYNTYSLNIPETNGTIAVEEDILDIIEDNEFVTATVLNEHNNRLIDLETAGYLTEIPNTYPTYAAISSMGYLTSFTETDPTVPTYIKNITEDNISSWNSRALSYYLYADGTKNLEVIKHLVFDLPRRNYSIVLDGLYYIQPAGQVSGSSFGNNTGWAPIIRVGIYENTSIIDLYFYTIFDKDSNNDIVNNNWSISLYKTDRLTKANIESMTSIPYTLNSNSIFAFKSDLPPTITESTVAEWGFTKNTGTLTEETDPTVPSYIKNITETNISDWNDKVSKLELSGLGYITQASLDSNSYAGYAYVYAAYSYLITSITDNELVISTALNNHESRIDTLENTQSDWDEDDSTEKSYILNKPHIENLYFVEGSSSAEGSNTSGAYLAVKWEGTIPGITEPYDGLAIMYRIRTRTGVSTGGVVLSIDNEHYYPVVINATTKMTSHYPVGSTILLVFNATQAVSSVYLTSNTATTVTGCWQATGEYWYDTNTVGYQLRNTVVANIPFKSKTYRYRLLFTDPNGTKLIPANTSTSTNATSSRTVNQDPINPFGPIYYYNTTTVIEANAKASASNMWQQYAGITLGYSFNRTNAALVLTYPAPIYIKCAPQSDGSAIIDADNPYVQTLPSTEDGKIYIFLGIATSVTTFELLFEHPIYYYANGAIRLWTGIEDRIAALESTVDGIESLLASI